MNILNRSQQTNDEQFLNIPDELSNSSVKILAYAGISQEKADSFQSNLETFIKMKDKSASDTFTRNITEQLTAVFYEAYISVLKRVQAENNQSRLYQMFLQYAYMDERLLTAQQCNTLYNMIGQEMGSSNYCVYHLPNWLGNILAFAKDPSVNEFGQDYSDLFLEKKKRKELTDNDKAHYDADMDGRFQHEVDNLFKLGQRLCYGQIGSYCPILHQEMFGRNIEAALVTPTRLEASLNKILAVDYSAFHREIVYSHTNRTLSPELIMKQILPDLIIMPGFGSRGVMWQILSGKSKSSPGRFIFPSFTDENLDDLMIDVVAKFRWDLSKNVSGSVINKANEISLFVDYSDYIQFYAKNRDLSDEAKDKLKTIIKRKRNSAREIFSLDYHTWINFESHSLLRLNKVSRDIFFKHCPFAKSIRVALAESPIYNPLITQLEKLRDKQCHILESRYKKTTTHGVPIDPDLLANLHYYKS